MTLTKTECFVFALLVTLYGLGCFLVGVSEGRSSSLRFMRQEAADHGAGEYVADPKTGKVEWQWRTGK